MAPTVQRPDIGHRIRALCALAALALACLGAHDGAAPTPTPNASPGPDRILAAPAAQPDMVWVVEQIELNTSWIGDTSEGRHDFIPDRQLITLAETVIQGPRTTEGAIELLVEHPAWIAPGEPFEMRTTVSALLDSRGSFGTATPSATLRTSVRCGTTVPRGGTCGGTETESTSFVSEPNAQNRSVALDAGAAFPPGTWTAPPAPGTVDAWTVGFDATLGLGTSFASFGISGRIWYRYSARPAAPPTMTLTGRAVGRPQPGALCPLNGARVDLLRSGAVIATTRALEPDGRFTFAAAPRVADLAFRVTLEHMNRDPLNPGAFRITYEHPAPAGAVPFVETFDFDARPVGDPHIRNVIFDDLAPNKPNPPGSVLPSGAERAAVGVIYCHAWEAYKLTEIVDQTLDLTPPLDIVAYSATPGVFWRGRGTFGIGAGLDPFVNIGRANGTSEIADGGRPDNREWHEFGHHVMADAMGDLIPNDVRTCPPGRPAGFDCNHLGYFNALSVDSWKEGFAEFYSMMVGSEVLHEARPERYRVGGNDPDVAPEIDLEWNYLAFLPDFAETDPADGSLEELAVAGLLLDLVDPADELDSTRFPADDGTGLDYADCMALDLAPDLWSVIFTDWTGMHPRSPDAPDDFGYVFDVKMLHDILEGEGYGQGMTRGGPLNDLDELFVAHGFFVDENGSETYDLGEPIGGSGRPDHPSGLARRRFELQERFNVRGSGRDAETGRPIEIVRYRVALRFQPPHDVHDLVTDLRSGAGGRLPLVGAPWHADARFEITAHGPGGYRSTEPLVVENAEYWRLVREGPGDRLLDHVFQMRRDPVAYLPHVARPPILPELGEAMAVAGSDVDPASRLSPVIASMFGSRGVAGAFDDPVRVPIPCRPRAASPTPTPTDAPPPGDPVPVRVDPGFVFENLDARLTIAGYFFETGATAFVGGVELEALENLGPDLEPPHYHRLRGNLTAGLPPGSHDLRVVNPDGRSGVLRDGFTLLAAGAPTPTPDLPVRVMSITASDPGRPGQRTALLPGDPLQFHTRVFHTEAEEAPAVLVVELRGPEGDGALRFEHSQPFRLLPSIGLSFTTPGDSMPDDLPPGEYTLSATVKAYGGQVEGKSQVYIARGLVMADDFEDPSSGWAVGRTGEVEARYVGGEYAIAIGAPRLATQRSHPLWRAVENVVIEADARSLAPAVGGHGLAIDVSEDGRRALRLLVTTDRRISLSHRVLDVDLGLLEPTYWPHLGGPETTNHLMLARRDAELRLYADGVRLRTLDLLDVRAGWAGVFAASLEAPTEARFDEVRVYSIR